MATPRAAAIRLRRAPALLLLAATMTAIANGQGCGPAELADWIKSGASAASGRELLPDWGREGTEACDWSGVTCEDGCDVREIDITGLGLTLFENSTDGRGCNAFSLVCGATDDPSDYPECLPFEDAQTCFDAIGGDLVNGFAIASSLNLTKVLLGGNLLTGTWPRIRDISPSLEEIDLSGHILERHAHLLTDRDDDDEDGEAEAGEQLMSLRVYRCDGCNLVGTLPSELDFSLRGVWAERFPNLEVLSIAGSKMNGSLPDGFSTLENLKFLNLSSNQLSGSIPESWSDLVNIEQVDLSGNENLSTVVPEAWGEILKCDKDEPLRCEKRGA